MSILEILADKNIINKSDIAKVEKQAATSGKTIEEILEDQGITADIILDAEGERYRQSALCAHRGGSGGSAIGEADVELDRIRERVANGRGRHDVPVHLGQRGVVGVGIDAHVDLDLRVAGVSRREPEERPQVELARDGDVELADRDAALGECRDVPDREAVAERCGNLLDRVRGAVGAAESARLVGLDRELADGCSRAEPALPVHIGLPYGVAVVAVLFDGADEGDDRVEVDIVEVGLLRHGSSSVRAGEGSSGGGRERA